MPEREERETCRHSVQLATFARESKFSSDSRLCRSWATGSERSHCPVLVKHLCPPLSIRALLLLRLLLLSIHLSTCIPFPSCLLISPCTTPIISAPLSLQCSSLSLLFSGADPGAGITRPPGCSKNPCHTPSCTCGLVQVDRGFHRSDDGAQSSFLNPHKSVGGLILTV